MTRKPRKIARMALATSCVLLLVLAFVDPAGLAQGYLAAFVLLSMFPIGSLTLLLIGGITGGRWAKDLAPIFQPTAHTMPLLLIAFVPVILFRQAIYPWPGDGIPGDVARFYLNPPFFAARTLIGLLVLSALCWHAVWTRQASAGIGLMVAAVILSFLPVDWILTLPPRSTSAAFGLGFGIEQILAALGFCAILAPPDWEARANTDLAGLIVSAILGTVYFAYMEFIITWYGNIPDKVHWYVVRTVYPWPIIAFLAFAIGAAIPFLCVLAPAMRSRTRGLRIVGALVLTGIALHIAWLTLPAFSVHAVFPALLSAITLGLFLGSFELPGAGRRLAHAR